MKRSIHVRHAIGIGASLALALGCGSADDDDTQARDPAPGPATCTGMVDRELSFCPMFADQREQQVQGCERDRTGYQSVGCAAAHDRYLGCSASARWDCEEGAAGCEDEQNGYFACVSQFVQRTGCTYSGPQAACPPSTPNTLGCLTAQPPDAACVPLPGNTGAANLFCCP